MLNIYLNNRELYILSPTFRYQSHEGVVSSIVARPRFLFAGCGPVHAAGAGKSKELESMKTVVCPLLCDFRRK